MADPDIQTQEPSDPDTTATQPKDIHSVLVKVIGEISEDPVLLRKLVYALARQNLKPDPASAGVSENPWNATSITELAAVLKLERAIARVEAEVATQSQKAPTVPAEVSTNKADAGQAMIVPEDAGEFKIDPVEPGEITTSSEIEPASAEELPQATALRVLPNAPHVWPERRERIDLTEVPQWLDRNVPGALNTIDYAPVDRSPPKRGNVVSFVQLVAASVLGVVLYVGVSSWIQMSQQQKLPAAPAAATPQRSRGLPAPQTQASKATQSESQSIPPFPLPRSYGVYAVTQNQLVTLEPLPIKVPISRVRISAEITQPSKAKVAGDNLAFVIFRRDLVNSAPQSVAVRIVARVRRDMKFVNGKPVVTPVEGSWRIRDKSFELQVSPLDDNREMVVIQSEPNFVFQPGRYALVLNGYGYDFTVAGNINAPEQCLEQVQVVDGTVVSECPKS